MNIDTKIVVAKGLRKSFNSTQRDLLTETFWGDDDLARKVREMQAEHKAFQSLVEEIKEENEELYREQILGM